MAGYGNRTATDPPTSDGDDSLRLGKHTSGGAYQGGHPERGSGTTSGAGYGNKSDPDPDMPSYDNSDLRFSSHDSTAPYQGGGKVGSGSTAGAGFGNKTGEMASHDDSVIGRVMEKFGGMVGSEGLVGKGRAKREKEGLGREQDDVTSAN